MTPLYTISRASNENPELIIASFVNTSALSDSSDIDEAQQFETINSGLQELAQKIDRVAQTTPLNQNRQDRLDALSFDLMDFEGMAAKFPHGEKREEILSSIGKLSLRLYELQEPQKPQNNFSDRIHEIILKILFFLAFFVVIFIKILEAIT